MKNNKDDFTETCLESFSLESLLEEKECDVIVRKEAVRVVYGVWFSETRPMKRHEIIEATITRIKKKVSDGDWKNNWKVPNERTVGRRIDEACTVTPYAGEDESDRLARLEEISKGVYRPNLERWR